LAGPVGTPVIEIALPKDVYYDIGSDSLGRKTDAIRGEVLRSNPQVTHFGLERNVDDIALLLTLGEGAEQTSFRLFGSKHDFYRLSMGVRLEETLAVLAKADPNIAPAGVESVSGTVTVRLAYAWPAGHVPSFAVVLMPEPEPEPPPKPEPAPAPKPVPDPYAEPERNPNYFVPARQEVYIDTPVAEQQRAQPPAPAPAPQPARSEARPPAAAQAPVAVAPPPQTATVVPPTVRESTATAPPAQAEPARAVSPDPQVESAYQAAREAGTLQALTRFLTAHPGSAFEAAARVQADELRERAAYARARERDDVEGYRGFLENFPASPRRGEIEVRAQALEEERRRQEAERRQQADSAKRLRAAYEQTRKLDSPEAYRIFLAAYPDSSEAAAAKKRLAVIQADEDAFREARGAEARLDGYLTLYPEGRHAAEAASELQTLRSRRMEADYRTAAAVDTAEAYRAFLEQWPRSPRAREAGNALAAKESGRVPASSRPSGPPMARLVAVRVATAPNVDGDGSDPAWADAPELTIPVGGAAKVKQVQVRAVHDSRTVYLLMRWVDATHDATNRPWLWSAEDKTYRQSSQMDDGAAIMLFGASAPDGGCMLDGQEWQGDSWMWRANWSDISGLADDTVMRGSRDRLPQSNPYPAGDGSGQVWISRNTDAGTPGWSFFIPLEFTGPVVGSYQAAKARGSRADVASRGTWTNTGDAPTWTVEFSRALVTGHDDDQPLAVGQPAVIAFAVYDQADKANHSASGLVRLELQEGPP